MNSQMIHKKIVFLIFFIVLTLVTNSFLATAITTKSNNCSKILFTKDNDEVEIYAGKMIIDCEWDYIACEINVVDSPYEKLEIKNQDKVTIKFYADWEIKNEKTTDKEKWFYEITLKNGLSPYDEIIDTKNITIEDTPLIPDNQNGTIYFDGFSLGRDDFDSDSFLQKPEIRNFRIELRCKYYRGSWISGELELLSEADLWTVARIDLANEGPTIPFLHGDIGEGETGDIDKTYSFTAESSVDPDGDLIKYVFFWNDGTMDETPYMESGNIGIKSHQWTDEIGPHKVSVYAQDRFGAISSTAELNFNLPRKYNKMEKIVPPIFKQQFLLFNYLTKLNII